MTPDDLSIFELTQRFNTEESELAYFETIRWPDGPVCPHCQNSDASKIYARTADKAKKVRVGLRECGVCGKQFRATIGTIFEDSHIPLNKWLVAFYLICGAKKGMSAMQLKRHLGLGSYKTAWFMAHRIRHAMQNPSFLAPMKGIVEVDECYFGPKARMTGPGCFVGRKTAVVGLVERETGKRRSVLLDRVNSKNLQAAVREHVEAGSTINTDELPAYKGLKTDYTHKTVRHSSYRGKKEYHRVEAGGEVVTTNHAESSFSLLRRGVIGSFHHISNKHLGKYVAEFDFRWNSRKSTDGARTVSALAKTAGKRLTYKQPVKKD